MAGLPTFYKRYQGQYTRSITAASMAVVAAAICYFIYVLLAKYVPTDNDFYTSPANATDAMVFAKAWKSADGKIAYQEGEAVTKEAREDLIAAKEDRWYFRAAHPVEYALYWQFGVPSLVFIVFAAGIFYSVNSPKFADFLIATESEMKKVSWSSKAELIGSTMVVIVTVVFLSAVIYSSDFIWTFCLQMVGALPR